MKRTMTFADKFYPKSPEKLKKFFEVYAEKVKLEFSNNNFGMILPHAGYVYSGKTALLTLKESFRFGKPERVIILGTNHTGTGIGICSVWERGEWETPFGNIAVDEKITEKLLKFDIFVSDYAAHTMEHSIEVILPFLKYYYGDIKLVPIVYNFPSHLYTMRIVEILKKLELKSTLIIASSDLNHYDPHDITMKKDEIFIENILKQNVEELFKLSKKITACGTGPIAVLLNYFSNVKLVYHTTSAEFSNDYNFTVGYAGFVLW
ncbi:hypothetical protein SU69_08805 [Thermosipho melanesiensis]|uniref:MEMO1 family protein Tmel_1742 n=2 Tax=Thermosipho melanesiensis TaxID=46541 RepID=A6LNT0_THEM4|nr:AmmeMemoRadiSam system protein B [Thermosipho melanesiensis]ABR31581.1 protein of unknown function DUF52 [Thermosipho melanesiensis BI429]APT74615.1 hypothetical protein BW47_09180 [Thermosipho melanesiensis]OOC35318.1 hypothetical protein SU69_08805 [Thermosipho melanesiensis]OOC35536.1 hypothetical protein SU70_08815 [Thermosipho melanesiensis]OOC36573.1 hypothetical protein SU68_08870 [Thermosipho melanesiensis]